MNELETEPEVICYKKQYFREIDTHDLILATDLISTIYKNYDGKNLVYTRCSPYIHFWVGLTRKRFLQGRDNSTRYSIIRRVVVYKVSEEQLNDI
jgi:hypothetical protein